jgi:hypothetical protein
MIRVGTDRARLWADLRGVTIDLGARRYSWYRPGAWVIHHVRQHSNGRFGRFIAERNPYARSTPAPS